MSKPSKRRSERQPQSREKRMKPSTSPFSEDGKRDYPDWPAPLNAIEAARNFIIECAEGRNLTLLVPDKDADGLSSGRIMHHTLVSLGLPPDSIRVHIVSKCSSVFQPEERAKLESYYATRIIILDQGSRGGPAVVSPMNSRGEQVRTLIIDHHESSEFPDDALVVTGCHSPPKATSSLLTYMVCSPLHESVQLACAATAIIGVFGDLGPNAIKWGEGPWPQHLGAVVKKETKKMLVEAVSLLNAPRRTAEYNVYDAWYVLLHAQSLQGICTNRDLQDARARVSAEVERCTHVAPKFSRDGRVALLRIHSALQVHPLIATRWSGYLRTQKLQFVMVANDGYHPSGTVTNFSCRIAASLRKLSETERPNLIEILKEYARKVPDDNFLERIGSDFARGHKEATGGIIPTAEFERLVEAMEIGVKDAPVQPALFSTRQRKIDHSQKTKITAYFSPVSRAD